MSRQPPPAEPGAEPGPGAAGAFAENLTEGRWDAALDNLLDLWAGFVAYLPRFGLALVVLLAFSWLARAAGRWERPYGRISGSPFVQDLLRHAARSAVFVVGALFALQIVGATAVAAAVLGTAGVFGLAVGFAFKDLVENYIAGVLLSLRQPFEPNDHVLIAGHEGKVMRLTSRATILMTLDGNHLRIPNADVFKGVILNYSRNPRRRFSFAVGVGNDEDLAAALRLGIDTLAAVPGVLAEPEPWAQIETLAESSVTLRFFGWIDQREASFPRVRSESIRRVKEALEGAGMDLPEPIYRVRVAEPARPREEAEPGARAGPAAPSGAPAPPDLTAEQVIDRQIARERVESPEEQDLLRREAPKE